MCILYHLAVVDVFCNGYLVGQKGSTRVSDKTKDPDGLSLEDDNPKKFEFCIPVERIID